MNKKIAILNIFIILAACLCGCNNSNKNEERTIKDCAGDIVSIPNEVDEVINLVTYGCQAMVGLDLGDYLIGINEDSIESPWMAHMYPRINEIPKYDQYESAESLLMTSADVVLCQESDQARNLRSKGVTALTFSYYSIDDMKIAIQMLGELFGDQAKEKCNKYLNYLDDCIESINTQMTENNVTKESLYYINGVSNKGLYKTAGKGSTNSACANLSYTIFATDALIESPANTVDSEAILFANPENIIIGGKYQHVLYDKLMSDEVWKDNYAVSHGNVFKVPMGISAWNRYGIEIAIMIPWTTKVVYPEYFDFDLIDETIKFYKDFTGYTLTEEEANYILGGLTPNGEKEIAN